MRAALFNDTIVLPFIRYRSPEVSGTEVGESDAHEGLIGFLSARKIGSEEMEVPSQILYALYNLTKDGVHGNYWEKYSELSVPLIWNSHTSRRTADSILYNLFTQVTFSDVNKITRVETPKGYRYYGGPGLILKEDRGIMKPLLLYTHTVKGIFTANNPDGAYTLTGLNTVGLNLRVAPSVFSDDDMMSKLIVKKLIPSICKPLNLGYSADWLLLPGSGRIMTPRVIVEDLSKWILQPVKPNVATFEQDLKQFYADDRIIDEIVDSL